MNTTEFPINAASCVVRKTDSKKGRSRWLAPGLAPVRQLHYGRIILDAGDEPVRFETAGHETGLVCLKGAALVKVAEQSFQLAPYDALYVPRDAAIEVLPGPGGCDLAEISAAVENRYPLRFISFAEVRRNPGLHFKAGGPTTERDLNILIGKNVEAGKIVAGVTFSAPGNWTSWPPHEHAAMLEEAYLYIAMPAPAWGVQFVYTNPADPELVAVVHEGDCVVMPGGYHPNVAAPGGSIGFLWMMAAHREVVDRQFGVVNVQPEYASGGSGIEAGRANK
ncbi:MAG: 5-deoxy-glucuronate isomerase [Bryobacteraceae bacterium]|jgi:5-deoxy-glucuronate isomerase